MNDFGGRAPRASMASREFFHDPYAMPQDQGSFVNLRSHVYLVWRGKVFLALCLAVALALGILHVRQFEPAYYATATVLYEPERLQIMDMANILAEPEPGSGLANQIAILYSTTLLERVVDRLDLDTVRRDAPPEPPTPIAEEVWEVPEAIALPWGLELPEAVEDALLSTAD